MSAYDAHDPDQRSQVERRNPLPFWGEGRVVRGQGARRATDHRAPSIDARLPMIALRRGLLAVFVVGLGTSSGLAGMALRLLTLALAVAPARCRGPAGAVVAALVARAGLRRSDHPLGARVGPPGASLTAARGLLVGPPSTSSRMLWRTRGTASASSRGSRWPRVAPRSSGSCSIWPVQRTRQTVGSPAGSSTDAIARPRSTAST